jgi:flagellar FliL protein
MTKGSRGKLPIMIIAVALVVVLLGGVGAFVMKGRGGKGNGAAEEKKPAAPLALGEFVVNLADQGEIRYLKANIVLSVTGEVPQAGGHGEESGPSPAIRDAVIEVLSSKRFAELAQPGGKEKLKKEIVAAVNKRLEGCQAVDVYFSDFAMQ